MFYLETLDHIRTPVCNELAFLEKLLYQTSFQIYLNKKQNLHLKLFNCVEFTQKIAKILEFQ